ncbi:MAG: glycosyltransferase family 4 protein [Caldilineaceae bacterium]|nr:glycosyltransferase family 4 protein [Caldilineaceae bacterium]
MHILINGWFAGRLETGSGQYLHQLLTHLAGREKGVRYTLLVPNATAIEPALPNVTVMQGALIPGPRQLAKVWWEQVTVPRTARSLAADALWVPYWAAPLRQPVPTVVTVHDMIPRLLPAYRGGAPQRLYTRLVSASARRATAVITVSNAAARDIVAELNIDPSRVHAVPHGPNAMTPDALEPDQLAAVRARYNLPPRYFLYLGGFDVRKNVGGILAGYARYLAQGGDAAVKLVIVGKLPTHAGAFAPDPQKAAADLGIADAVIFCGWAPDEDKPALYHMAVAYLFPSLYEGFGMTVIEAMQAGTPVVTSATENTKSNRPIT